MPSHKYVILVHDHPFLHWDLMLEQNGVLQSWRLHAEPMSQTEIAAETLPDHRLAYLEYEGPVSDDRGTVSRWDRGHYSVLQQNEDSLAVQLAGEKLNGPALLSRQSDTMWLLRYPT